MSVALVAALALDQLTKHWALKTLDDGRVIEIVPTVRLELTFNPGVAFGMGAEIGSPLAFTLLAVVLALLGWVAVRTIRNQNLLATVFLAVAAGGAIGNVWDRISRAQDGPLSGHVVDFVAVEWFAVFNVADILTTCGIAAWAIVTFIRGATAAAVKPEQAAPHRQSS
ncbi:MAG: signal peptidase II [Cryobacterium sp.]|nr:signal peptidase II [Cryobacterium sp.]